jgi:predicted  nucleic acid-binding Zn-ribbon protein
MSRILLTSLCALAIALAAVLPMDAGELAIYTRTGEIPKDVRDALMQAVALKQAVVETQRKISTRQSQISTISQEQNRLRDNMKTVAQNTEYYNRLLKKLDEQESQIETLQKEIAALQSEEATQRKAVADYLSGMNIG